MFLSAFKPEVTELQRYFPKVALDCGPECVGRAGGFSKWVVFLLMREAGMK